MSSKTARLCPSNAPLPTITPHLMPFHVEHTGSAPLSTYFIVKPVSQYSQPDCTANASSPSLTQHVKARFTSAFRGRKIHGLGVNFPDGYSGAVLKTEELGRGAGKAAAPKKLLSPSKTKRQKGKRTRSSTRKNADDNDEDEDVTMDGESLEDDGVIHTLRPTAKFSSFTLWNADVDVDEGRDEYLRALSEYQQLSAELHRID